MLSWRVLIPLLTCALLFLFWLTLDDWLQRLGLVSGITVPIVSALLVSDLNWALKAVSLWFGLGTVFVASLLWAPWASKSRAERNARDYLQEFLVNTATAHAEFHMQRIRFEDSNWHVFFWYLTGDLAIKHYEVVVCGLTGKPVREPIFLG
ncbi:hypothetical protein D4R54_00725 [archaeon]|nr:MAG: hypothetical protein D4R54_00725 [archaeon]